MKFFDQLQEATREDREDLYAVPVIREALAGHVGLEGYVAFLTQAYYHVRHTVPLMMACGARLPSSLEWLRKAVCEYIDEEYGHEQWILNDIAACGGDAALAQAHAHARRLEEPVVELIEQCLAQDPRPAYQLPPPERRYGVRFWDVQVRWHYPEPQRIRVLEVVPA